MLRALGWRVVLAQPVPLRCVVVIYPHTSNWDFPIGLMAKWVTGIHFRFVGKDTLFAGPFGPLFTRWGGIPVNRRERTGIIAQLAQRFATEDDFRLVFAPEGTRSRTEHWKSGFYHLARAAGVPVALAFIDYARREVGVGAYRRPHRRRRRRHGAHRRVLRGQGRHASGERRTDPASGPVRRHGD